MIFTVEVDDESLEEAIGDEDFTNVQAEREVKDILEESGLIVSTVDADSRD